MKLPAPRLLIAALLVWAAWLAVPASPRSAADPWALAIQTILGPLRGPTAGLLRLRAGFARAEGRAEESIRFQQFALELDPGATDAVVWLANEIATQIPLAATAASSECARLGIGVLRRARFLGNRDPRLWDWESFLWSERVAPRATASARDRLAALDEAIAACEGAPQDSPRTMAVAAELLDERARLRYAAAESRPAGDDFERAAQYERLLAQAGDGTAAARAALFDLKSQLSRLDAGDAPDPPARRALLEKIEGLRADDPFLPLARSRGE